MVLIHVHAEERAKERGASKEEIIDTIETGEKYPVKQDRHGFRKTNIFNENWNGKYYFAKQIECIAVWEDNNWIVITVIVKYF